MSFQIQTKDKEAIPINTLDREAAAFWGKEVHPKDYANPFVPTEGMSSMDIIRGEMCSNWFDVIGHAIHIQGRYCEGWANIAHTLLAEAIGSKFIDTSAGYNERSLNVRFFKSERPENINNFVLDEEVEIGIYATLEYYRSHINLMKHWESKGYIPVQVKE